MPTAATSVKLYMFPKEGQPALLALGTPGSGFDTFELNQAGKIDAKRVDSIDIVKDDWGYRKESHAADVNQEAMLNYIKTLENPLGQWPKTAMDFDKLVKNINSLNQALHSEKSYRIVNADETKGKTIVGVLVTDERVAHDFQTSGMSKETNENVWAKEISELNKVLAVDKKAIEFAVIEDVNGYTQYLTSIKDSKNYQLIGSAFVGVFHGISTMSDSRIVIGGGAYPRTEWDVYGYKTGATYYTRGFIKSDPFFLYCTPLEADPAERYTLPMPSIVFKKTLGL